MEFSKLPTYNLTTNARNGTVNELKTDLRILNHMIIPGYSFEASPILKVCMCCLQSDCCILW